MNEKITWRNGVKVIIHLADAGAHGKEFTLSDKYPAESEKLKTELLKCCQKSIKIFGYIITEDARSSFNQCQNYYKVMEVHMRFANLKSQKNIQIQIQKNISIEVNIWKKVNVL